MRTNDQTAGVLYLIVILTSLFSELFARSGMIVPGDASPTTKNIAANSFVTTQQFTRNLNHWLSIHFVLIFVQEKQKSRQNCESLQYLIPS